MEPSANIGEPLSLIARHSFPRATMKREMMCRRFEALARAVESGDVDNIQMALGDFLAEARSLHDVIGNEGNRLSGFTEWWARRKEELKRDPLMKWAHTAREEDFHGGVPSIEVIGWEIRGGFEYDESKRPADANQMLSDRGMFWVSGPGTVSERIQRAALRVGSHTQHISITGMPADVPHRPESSADLIDLCRQIMERNQALLHAVKQRFGVAAASGPAPTAG